jgi:hypothetical protein
VIVERDASPTERRLATFGSAGLPAFDDAPRRVFGVLSGYVSKLSAGAGSGA